MNKLPDRWQIKTLGEVAKIITGKTPLKSHKEYFGGKIPFVKPSDLDKSQFINNSEDTLTELGFKFAPFIPKNSVLVSCIGNLGKKAILSVDGSCNQQLNAIIPNKNINHKFIYYQIDIIKNWMEENSSATTIKILNKSRFEKAPIILPPLEIQKQIAKKLDYLFDKIDKALTFLNENKEYIKKYRLSILKYAFEGKLTLSSKNWKIKTLGEVCEILDNIRKPINATERKQRLKKSNLRYAYYGATGQIGYIDNFLFDFEAILLGEDGAPFLEPFKNKAYIVSGKYWVNNHAHILMAKDNISINKFVCYFLNTVDYMPYVSGTTRLKLNQFSMKQIKIPISPIETQKEIVSILDKSFKSMDEIERLNNENINNLLLLKKSLLKEAFSGRLI